MLAKTTLTKTDAASDAELLDAWVETRDRDSLTELIGRYQRLVMAVCLRQCRRRVDVEDAFQATFLQLSRSAVRIQNPAALAGWLHAVAYRIAVRTRNMVEPVSLDRVDLPSDDQPLTQLARRHELQLLDEELSHLPEAEKTPLVMHYLDELTVGEIADRLGTTVGSIRGRLQRGRKRLRGRMIRRGVDLTAALVACELLPKQWINAAELTAQTVETCHLDLDPTIQSDPSLSPSPRLPRLENLLRPEGSTMLSVPAIATGSCITGLLLMLTLPTVFEDDPKQKPAADQPVKVIITANNPADENTPTAITSAAAPIDPFGGPTAVLNQNAFGGSDPFGGSGTTGQGPGGELIPSGSKGIIIGQISPQKLVGSGKIEAFLNSPYRLNATDVPLTEFVDFLGNRLGLPVMIDQASLSEAKLSDSLEVTTRVTEANLGTILKHALEPLGLRAMLEDEVLRITVDPEAHALNGGDMSTWISVNDQAADKIVQTLQSNCSQSFNQIPLDDAVLQLSQEFDLPIMVITRALEGEGLTRDLPVTANVKDVTLESFLNIMLRENDLVLNIDESMLVITTQADAGDEQSMLTRLYWLDGTGLSTSEDATRLVESMVDVNSWETLGGPANLQTMQDEASGRAAIMVNQSFTNHRQIEKLLDRLRDSQRTTRATLTVPVKNDQ